MLPSKPIRIATALLVTLPSMLCARMQGQAVPQNPSQLPPTPATSLPATPPATPEQQPAKRATVSYSAGQVSVTADNSSLNQILYDIAQQTGMKITGGVTDERVYGSYGPAAPAKVLGQLLDGTGSNMLLLQNADAVPTELVLTPRNGGPTPPNPNAPGFDDEDNSRGPAGRRPPFGPGRFPVNQNQGNTGNIMTAPVTTPPAPPATTPTTQQSPNGVKTPQQIYDELQRIQQQGTQSQQGVPISRPQ